VYPNGEMRDYEAKFYLPFKGVSKPIYAVPGNHDWFNALDGFAANLMRPDAAQAALTARTNADLRFSSTNEARILRLISEAARLRQYYGIRAGLQRAPFFELHTDRFSLIAVDTGILKSVDEREFAWLRAALDRSKGTFTMAILGHPLYAAGRYQAEDPRSFQVVHDLLKAHQVPIVMAGDTHDFEYYREPGVAGGSPTHHFVNGGGGAYLSIGTALGFPQTPALADFAYYPPTDAMHDKLDAETPAWKRPVWWWVRRFGAWPFVAETLSAIFDFNRAPFFQSFIEVRVEPSANRVRLLLYGVDGPLRWKDLETGGDLRPTETAVAEPVEFVVPMNPP
ncbi:MAG: metallophosphoesterase family protein, partial [Vicinamibacterales bacterium]